MGSPSATIVCVARSDRRTVNAGLMRIQPGQQRRPHRPAAAGVVELRESRSARREAIDIRRRDLTGVAPEVGKAHLVDEDHDDVRPPRLALLLRKLRQFDVDRDRVDLAGKRIRRAIVAGSGAGIGADVQAILGLDR